MRILLVSADLTADEIPVTSGHRRFDPDQGDDPPGPAIGEITSLGYTNKLRLLCWSYGKFEGFWPRIYNIFFTPAGYGIKHFLHLKNIPAESS